MLLDVGCGSGLSGDRLTELGHEWIGTDISKSMLEVAQEREVDGGLIHFDMGHGCPFRPGARPIVHRPMVFAHDTCCRSLALRGGLTEAKHALDTVSHWW